MAMRGLETQRALFIEILFIDPSLIFVTTAGAVLSPPDSRPAVLAML